MKRIRLVSFDAAGTLINHSWDPAEALVMAAHKVGVQTEGEAPKELYRKILEAQEHERREVELLGDSGEIRAFWQKTIAEWLSMQGKDPELSREIYPIARSFSLSPTSPFWKIYPDVMPTLASLKEKGYKLAVISNWDSTLLEVLKNVQISRFFDAILASLPLGIEKPNPAIFNQAIQQTGVSPKEALHVGDSWEDDVLGARSAGMSYLYLDRQNPPDSACRRISSLEQVWEYLP